MSEIENGGNAGAPGNPVAVTVVDLAGLAAGGKQVSAFLLRRLAEAVDGFRGEEVFCSARFTPDQDFDFKVAVKKKDDPFGAVDDEVGIFGPFFTPEARGPDLKDTQIESITVKLKDGRVIKVDPQKTDSLFWTVSAVEKFLVPYYASVNSAPFASLMLNSFDREGMVCMEHGPETEPTVKKVSDAKPLDPGAETPSVTVPLPDFTLPDLKGVGGFRFVSAG
jgi:hypothetical protein